jgi:hypothetical protein
VLDLLAALDATADDIGIIDDEHFELRGQGLNVGGHREDS